MTLLAIETSCDETSLALYNGELLGHVIKTQIPIHRAYGGVVPELASRDHIRFLLPLIEQLLNDCQCARSDLSGIAYTAGPGLMGSLLVGASLAIGLGLSLDIPILPVNHLEGHILSPMLTEPIEYPFVALLVSGGHTSIIHVKDYRNYIHLGSTLDDSVGECFDKVAKLMGLPYPGGPEIENHAVMGQSDAFQFPRPMKHVKGFDMSFSGLKTAVKTAWEKSDQDQTTRCNIAASFQAACADVLSNKLKKAISHTGARKAVIVGGVSANKYLRKAFVKEVESTDCSVLFPSMEFCTDNAAMIALCGWFQMKNGIDFDRAYVKSRWPLNDLFQN